MYVVRENKVETLCKRISIYTLNLQVTWVTANDHMHRSIPAQVPK